nr:MAG TPA: hypothetical protein [Caudoviricetes sp.]
MFLSMLHAADPACLGNTVVSGGSLNRTRYFSRPGRDRSSPQDAVRCVWWRHG